MGFFDDCRKARARLTGKESIATLNYMEDFFADGKNWTKGVYTAADGARCLRAAAEHVRVSKVDDTKYWLRQAIAESEPHLKTIEQYNDTREEFGEIVAVIRRAKELALAAQSPRAVRPATALPAPPVAEVLPPEPQHWPAPAARPAPAMIDVTPDQVRGRLPQPEPPRVRVRAPRRRSLFWEILSD